RQGSHHLAATVALPRRAREMDRNDACAIEQYGLGHGGSPTGTIPRVDLHAHAEAVEVNLVARWHCDGSRNLGSAVIVARQSGKATAQEQSQRADGGFVGGKSRQSKRTQAMKGWWFIYCFRFV